MTLSTFVHSSRSLKAQVAIGISLLFAAVVISFTLFQLYETRASMVEMLSSQQTTLVMRAADEIDEKFRDRKAALSEVAESMGGQLEMDLEAAPLNLREHRALNSMFDATFIFSVEGLALASPPDRPELRGIDVSRRPYFQDTIRLRRALISAPYRSPASGMPFVMMTAPVFDSNGGLIAILAGAINLNKPNFLGEIGSTPVGRTGYFYVLTRGAQPIVVSHPIKSRILGNARPASENGGAAQAQAGFEGTVEGLNSSGVRSMKSFKKLKETDWMLAAVLPSDEAFAPIEQSQRKTRLAGGFVVLLVAAAAWIFIRHALRPLDALRENVRQRLDDPHGTSPLAVRRHDEIGQLTFDFNRLMAAQQLAERALEANEERLRTITDNLPVLIGYLDSELKYQFNNQAYQDWFGIAPTAIKGRHVAELLGAADFAQAREGLEHALQGYAVRHEREIVIGGQRRYMQGTYLPHYGPRQEVLGIYVLVADITERKSAEDKLDFLANHDALTSLVNRGAFNTRLLLAIARAQRSHKACALMYLDVDRFKSINDTHGHGIGDQLLKAFAARLNASVRKTDLVGRLGGDEFVILIEDLASHDDVYLIAQKIIDGMREPFRFGQTTVRATTSVGITIFDGKDAAMGGALLLERADAALYAAKNAGRNTFKLLAGL